MCGQTQDPGLPFVIFIAKTMYISQGLQRALIRDSTTIYINNTMNV